MDMCSSRGQLADLLVFLFSFWKLALHSPFPVNWLLPTLKEIHLMNKCLLKSITKV